VKEYDDVDTTISTPSFAIKEDPKSLFCILEREESEGKRRKIDNQPIN
jgi:hypothetical protein